MLSKVLSKESCAECRFCCSFRRCSLWETPLFPKDECEKLSHANEYNVISEFRMYDDCGQMKLEHKYKTDNQEEEAACDYLDVHKGCILSDEDKPFDCKIWPLRIMKKDDKLVIAFTPTCAALGKEPSVELKELVCGRLGDSIYEYARRHPFIIKDYKEGFPVIRSECLSYNFFIISLYV